MYVFIIKFLYVFHLCMYDKKNAAYLRIHLIILNFNSYDFSKPALMIFQTVKSKI